VKGAVSLLHLHDNKKDRPTTDLQKVNWQLKNIHFGNQLKGDNL